MPTFRILDPFPVYLNLAGQLTDGGSLKFYDSGTTTPRDVYGDPDKTVNNGSSVLIGSDGRPVHDIWGDGNYRVRLYDADGTLIGEADNVQIDGGTGTAIPAMVSGRFLTNDGAVLSWDDVRQVPDPTGSAGKVLGNDGANLVWQAPPAPMVPDIVTGASSLQVGVTGSSKFLIQIGSGSCPASGNSSTSSTITFAKAYTTMPVVVITPTTNTAASAGIPVGSVIGKSLTGFSAFFNNAVFLDEGGAINNPVTFDWVAFGTVPEA